MLSTAAKSDEFAEAHPNGHILQTSAWGQFKSGFGWQAETVRAGESGAGVSGALVLFRTLPLGLTLAYVPRGPQADWNAPDQLERLMAALDAACRARHAICLKLEPDLPDTPTYAQCLASLGFRRSPHSIQPRRTLVVSLAGGEAKILGRMKAKTRYNIGLARKKGVRARPANGPEDIDHFTALMAATGARDVFAVHAPDYYRQAYALFHARGWCELFLAEYQGQVLAGAMAFAHGRGAWYFYGASSDRERNRMAPYLAQWEAMRWARSTGAVSYDLWGVPDEDEAALEAEFEARHDGLWGVYRFKRGFGGRLVRSVGAWDRVYSPVLYRAYVGYLRLKRRGMRGE
jgi:lipid II:glycine glycyltransferase (peptidoglycan interpeptide bridge formation enzyme)